MLHSHCFPDPTLLSLRFTLVSGPLRSYDTNLLKLRAQNILTLFVDEKYSDAFQLKQYGFYRRLHEAVRN